MKKKQIDRTKGVSTVNCKLACPVLDLGQPEVRNLHDEMLGSSDKRKQRDLSSGRNACLKSLTLGSKL